MYTPCRLWLRTSSCTMSLRSSAAARPAPGARLGQKEPRRVGSLAALARTCRGGCSAGGAQPESRSLGGDVSGSSGVGEGVDLSQVYIYIYIPSVDNSLERISVKDTGDTQKEMGEDPLVDSVVAIVDNIYF